MIKKEFNQTDNLTPTKKQVTRIAPSPTGKPHIGTIKSITLSWLWSLKNNANFIFRLDDTDLSRVKPKYINALDDLLKEYTINPNKSFKQSERIDMYQQILEQCVKNNLIYAVYETEEELLNKRGPYKRSEKVSSGKKYYRFDIGSDTVSFFDEIRGLISISLKDVSDPVVQKPNGDFTYSFASIVDDLIEQVTMIIRASDHIDNTAVQMSMMRKMIEKGIFPEQEIRFAHYPIFLYNNMKISKRSCLNIDITESFHPLVLANYIALLGSDLFGKKFYTNWADLASVFELEFQSKSNTANMDLGQLYQYQLMLSRDMDFDILQKWVPNTRLNKEQWNIVRECISKKELVYAWDRIFNDYDLHFTVSCDNEVCSDFSLEALGKLKPRFLRQALTGMHNGPSINALLRTMDPKLIEHRLKSAQKLPIMLYNSKTRRIDTFNPIKSNFVKIYCCGPTLYSRPHIGNYRCFVVFDVLFRVMKYLYKRVEYVRNITDIDDKIAKKAKETNKTISEVVSNAYEQFAADQLRLNIEKPTLEPKVSEHIPAIIDAIQHMIDHGFAYQTDDGVYFRIKNVVDYDCFGTNRVADMSKDDFALWRCNNEDWDSPWGKGRPGWHIECTVMGIKHLGAPYDIHGGGIDLKFPHHTNECAQAKALNHQNLANYWLHNQFVNIITKGDIATKMSKSLANDTDLSMLTESGYVIRLTLMRAHYLDPLTWSETSLKESCIIYNKWRRIMGNYLIVNSLQWPLNGYGFVLPNLLQAISNNLNLPNFIMLLNQNIQLIEQNKVSIEFYLDLLSSFNLIGIVFDLNYTQDEEIKSLVIRREELKKIGDYVAADKIRNFLKEKGVTLQDGSFGTSWYQEI